MANDVASLWAKQNQHEGDRQRLFEAVAGALPDVYDVLYAGSYVDVAASMALSNVTYVDVDKRANRFFADADGVAGIVREARADRDIDEVGRIDFVHADYGELDLPDESFDLLVSLYAGFVSEACTRFLRIGGWLLVNPSHGDAALASLDDRYELTGAVLSRSGSYRVSHDELDAYLVPNGSDPVTAERIHELGRGIAYTRSPFAYIFQRVR